LTLNQINYLNIGLMVVSLVAAFILPFEVFLFSYAFLGPAHYLTEISWLHDRQYFSQKKFDFMPLLLISVIILLGSKYVLGDFYVKQLEGIGMELTFGAFLIALIFVAVKEWPFRIVALFIGFAFILLTRESSATQTIFGVYLPTLIHVYIFTGAFILFGSLKSKSTSGYISFLVFLICPILCFVLFTDTSWYEPSSWGYTNYVATFADLNTDLNIDVLNNNPFNMQYISDNAAFYNPDFITEVMKSPSIMMGIDSLPKEFFRPEIASSAIFPIVYTEPNRLLYLDHTFVLVGRFIAFAYTYHYLNWFSKTSVIKWHDVSKWRFFLVVALWLGSIALYFKDYDLGFKWLFFLSFAHVLLEFPLNHQSFIGIGKEIIKRLGGSSAPPPPKAARPAKQKN
jgi:hypothetical protein